MPALVEKFVPSEEKLGSLRIKGIENIAHNLISYNSRQFDTYHEFLNYVKKVVEKDKKISKNFWMQATPKAVLTSLQDNPDYEKEFLKRKLQYGTDIYEFYKQNLPESLLNALQNYPDILKNFLTRRIERDKK